MEKPENNIIKLIATLLNQLFEFFRNILTRILNFLTKKEQPVDLHKPADIDPKQKRIIIIALAFILLLLAVNNLQEIRQGEMPFSQFLTLVQEGKIDKVVVSEHYISGVIKPEKGEGAGKPFMTVPLWQTDLAEMLAKNKVDFVVRSGDNWLSNLIFNWIIPIFCPRRP